MNARRRITGIFLAGLLALAGCKTATEAPVVGDAIDSLNGRKAATEQRLATVAAEAIAEGKTAEALSHYAKLYEHGSLYTSSARNKPLEVAVNYAQLLRRTGDVKRALEVLQPFVKTRRGYLMGDVYPIVLNEYAAINVELGEFKVADAMLEKVLSDEKASAFHPDANNLKGVMLDAQAQHKEAEASFRKALEGWQGDKTSVMNNLGLNLAAQGLFDESLLTLRQALVSARHKEDVARNIQMVEALRKAVVVAPAEKK